MVIKKKLKQTEYEELEKVFDKMDKIWHKYFGKECREFCPNCAQCKMALIYNSFKQRVFDECVN